MSEVPLYSTRDRVSSCCRPGWAPERAPLRRSPFVRSGVTPLPRIQSSQFLPLEPFSPEAGPSRTRSSHPSRDICCRTESNPLRPATCSRFARQRQGTLLRRIFSWYHSQSPEMGRKFDTLSAGTPFVPTVLPIVGSMDHPLPGYSKKSFCAPRCGGRALVEAHFLLVQFPVAPLFERVWHI